MTILNPLTPASKVWRYMSFAKLVWMLQQKQLWLSRVDLLGDQWELTVQDRQFNLIYAECEATERKARMEQLAAAVKEQRRKTFVNCWTVGEHESHALWQIYCPGGEGVAIQTTLARLRASTPLPLKQVRYGPHGYDGRSPSIADLVEQKRPMFAYENEIRIVNVQDYGKDNVVGAGLEWDPEQHLEMIWVHPEADFWFMETVTEAVRRLAPGLSQEGHPMVPWSRMASRPPF